MASQGAASDVCMFAAIMLEFVDLLKGRQDVVGCQQLMQQAVSDLLLGNDDAISFIRQVRHC